MKERSTAETTVLSCCNEGRSCNGNEGGKETGCILVDSRMDECGKGAENASGGEKGSAVRNQKSLVKVATSELWIKLSVKLSTMKVSKYSQERGSKDMIQLLQDEKIEKRVKKRRMFDEESIQRTIEFILHLDYVQLMSWGTKRIKVRGKYVRFLSLTRKMSCEVLWRRYCGERIVFSGSLRKLKRSKFTQICTALTNYDIKQRAYVYYKLHALVYENATMLKRIIEDQVREKVKRVELKKNLSGVLEFLKNAYECHLGESSDDAYHNRKFALGHGRFYEDTWTSTCRQFNSVYLFVDEIRDAIIDRNNQIGKMLETSKKKFYYLWDTR